MSVDSTRGRVIRLALVGVGSIARRHLDAMEAHPEVFELVAVCDPIPAAVEQVRTRFPGARGYAGIDDLLSGGGFDGAVVATPHFLHFEQAAAVARAGVGVLVEKPLVTSTAQLRALREISEASGAVIVAGQTRRHAPEVLAARSKTRDATVFGELQSFDILSFQDLRTFGGSAAAGNLHWLCDGERAGGGVTISLAIHQIDMLRFLADVDYTAAMATARFDPPFVNGAESQVAATLEVDNGAVGTLHADYLATRIPFAEAMTLIGENGSVTQHAAWLGQYRGPISFSTSEGVPSATFDDQLGGWTQLEEIQEDASAQSAFTNQLLNFAAVLGGEAEPVSGLIDNFNTIACVEAIVQSARTGRRVGVEKW